MVRDMRRRAVILLLGLLAGCGGNSGFNDPDTLSRDLRAKAQARVDKDPKMYGRGTKVTALTCVEGSEDHVFDCAGSLSTGEWYSASVTVSKDGKHYATRGG